MSKSTGNYIGIDEPSEEMYGKVMSLPDHAMIDYYTLVTRYKPDQISAINKGLANGSVHPRDAKMELAREIVSIFHGDEAAERAEHHFRTVFQEGELPTEMPTYTVERPTNVVDLLAATGLAKSKSEARRLIQQGGVRLGGEKLESIDQVVSVDQETVLQVGKRKFTKLVAASNREQS
jgi:tyrosyl-tRNA synthetase